MKKRNNSVQIVLWSTSCFVVTVLLIFGIIWTYLHKANNKTVIQRNLSNQTNVPKPKLKSGYTVNNIDAQWDIVTSEDLNISIRIPKLSTIQTSGGFDSTSPENETLKLSFLIPKELANAVVSINTERKSSKSVLELAERQARSPEFVNFTFTTPKKININGATGYEIIGLSKFNQFSYHFFTETKDRYLEVWYYYPWNETTRTNREEAVVKEIVSSFKLLK